ncbi:MAG: AI-2E family transporter [Erysipelotrichaceae bacterium]
MIDKLKKNIQFRNWFALATYIIILAAIVFNYKVVMSELMGVIWVFKPFFYALAFAFILNIPMMIIEKYMHRWFKPDSFLIKHCRGISIILTIILAVGVIAVLSMIIFPKIISSIIGVISNISSLILGFANNIDSILALFGIEMSITSLDEFNKLLNLPWQTIFQNALTFLGATTGGVLNTLTSFGASLGWAFAGFMLSLYLLASKETYILQLRKLLTVFLGVSNARRLFRVSDIANSIFQLFVGGQLLEACVQWALYWVILSLLGFPFPELLSTIIAVLALVPVFGPTISMVFNGLLILTVRSPLFVIYYLILFQLIQQFDNNVIYPRIVGKSVGLPGIWVLLSIFVFGDLFGIVGMLIAVPTTAFLYAILSEFLRKQLREKHIRVTLSDVIQDDEMEPIDI